MTGDDGAAASPQVHRPAVTTGESATSLEPPLTRSRRGRQRTRSGSREAPPHVVRPRDRSRPVTGAAVCAWRGAWVARRSAAVLVLGRRLRVAKRAGEAPLELSALHLLRLGAARADGGPARGWSAASLRQTCGDVRLAGMCRKTPSRTREFSWVSERPPSRERSETRSKGFPAQIAPRGSTRNRCRASGRGRTLASAAGAVYSRSSRFAPFLAPGFRARAPSSVSAHLASSAVPSSGLAWSWPHHARVRAPVSCPRARREHSARGVHLGDVRVPGAR